jgi:hypothetical protein
MAARSPRPAPAVISIDASGAPASPGAPGAKPVEAVDGVKPIERLRRVFSYARPYRGRLAIALVCLFIASGLGLVHPYFFGELAGAAFTSGGASDSEAAYSALRTNSFALVAVFLLQAVFIFFRHFYMTWIGERVVTDLRIDLFRHLATMPRATSTPPAPASCCRASPTTSPACKTPSARTSASSCATSSC